MLHIPEKGRIGIRILILRALGKTVGIGPGRRRKTDCCFMSSFGDSEFLQESKNLYSVMIRPRSCFSEDVCRCRPKKKEKTAF